MRKRTPIFINFIIVFTLSLHAQQAFDKSLFTISLIDDPAHQTLFSFHSESRIRETLSGPVVMKDDNLMFYYDNGYVLYNQKGAVIDSHSVFKKNKGLSKDDPKRIKFAFPVDNSTILYYQKVNNGEYPVTIYVKKLFKDRVKPLKEKLYTYYEEIESMHMFNLAHNTITDDMATTYFLLPQLIGFTSLTSGNKWWSLDRFYTFLSPIINEEDGKYRSFFPGIRVGNEKKKHQCVNPVQVFERDNNWYYTGVYSRVGSVEEEYYQTFYVYDQAGNVLYADALLKQTNRDAIIGEDEETYYTVKKIERFVFQPSVDGRGNVYYGIIDYVKKNIDVRKMGYYEYKAFPTEADLAHLVDVEKNIEYKPVSINCNMKLPGGKTIPNITILNDRGERIIAKARHLTKDGYIARISRIAYRDIERKLAKSRKYLPEEVKLIKNSLYKMSTVSCPYAVTISGPKGMIRTFKYTPGEKMLSARVIALRKSGKVLVRVDCEDFAEILIFKLDGTFVNRIIFNRQNYKERKDIVVATDKSSIIELDFESERGKEKFFKWEKVVLK